MAGFPTIPAASPSFQRMTGAPEGTAPSATAAGAGLTGRLQAASPPRQQAVNVSFLEDRLTKSGIG